MRIHIIGEPYMEEQRLLITPFIEAVEAVTLKHVLGSYLDMSVIYSTTSKLPRLVFQFSWRPGACSTCAIKGGTYYFGAEVTIKDLELLKEEGPGSFDVYVYRFARLMISGIALSEKAHGGVPVDQSAWQGGRLW